MRDLYQENDRLRQRITDLEDALRAFQEAKRVADKCGLDSYAAIAALDTAITFANELLKEPDDG